jgi:hypothetical protein
MGLIPLGILSSAGINLGAYELIETQVLGTAASSITFSGLASYIDTYEHLQIRVVAKTNYSVGSAWADSLAVRFNGDTASNYSSHMILADGATVTSSAGTTATSMAFTLIAGNQTSTIFGPAIIDITDAFNTTKNKTLKSVNGTYSTGFQTRLVSGAWRNTASLTSIGLTSINAANFVTGSRFSLYGIK